MQLSLIHIYSISNRVQKFPTSVLNQWTYHSRLYAAAKSCTTQKDMDLVQLVSFGLSLIHIYRLRAAHGKVLLLGVTHARNTFIHSVEEVPVSYTHLDVYKRQVSFR